MYKIKIILGAMGISFNTGKNLVLHHGTLVCYIHYVVYLYISDCGCCSVVVMSDHKGGERNTCRRLLVLV